MTDSSTHIAPEGARLRVRVPRRGRFAAVAVALLLAIGLGAAGAVTTAAPASAETNPTGTTIREPQKFYAYTTQGQNLDVTFTRTTSSTIPTLLRITSPAGVTTFCSIGTASGSSCSRLNLTSPTAGVWEVYFYANDDSVSLGFHTWNIQVQQGMNNLSGRVWSYRYLMYNSNPATFDLWYLSPLGYKYKATHTDFFGVDSVFEANQFGNVYTDTCTSAYRSIEIAKGGPYYDPAFTNKSQDCGTPYAIFFQAPGAGLPVSAVDAFGTTHVLNLPPVAPSVAGLAFTPDAPTTRSGQFTFTATAALGTSTLLIDADGDGQYGGPLDRTIPVGIASDGTQAYAFDGLDGAGNPLPVSVEMSAYLTVNKAGEIHVLSVDVESRQGISMTALNGPNNGTSTIYWNDSFLQSEQRLPCRPGLLDATAGVDTSGGPRHTWNCFGQPGLNPNDGIGGAWGDARSIDDWMFHTVDVRTNTVIVPAMSTYTVEKTSDPASGDTVSPGDEVTYTVTVTQSGPDAVDASLSDELSNVLDDAALVGTVTSSIGTATLNGASLEWSGTVPAGQVATITYTVKVKDRGGLAEDGDYILGNVVTSDGCVTAADCETTHPVGSYTVAKSVDPASGADVQAGDTVTYTVTVTQVGAGAVTGASLEDDLSDVLDDATWNDDLSASSSTASFDATPETLAWSGDLTVGQQVTITYSVTVTSLGTEADTLANVVTSDGCDTGACETENPVIPKIVTIQVLKIGEDSTGEIVPMDGSQWAIYSGATGGTAVIASLSGAGSTGLFEATTLTAGNTYWLEETKALPGFQLLAQRVQFTADVDGQVQLAQGTSSNVTVTHADGVSTIRVQDVPQFALPTTGGTGTTWIYLTGGGIVLAALLVLAAVHVSKRRPVAQMQTASHPEAD